MELDIIAAIAPVAGLNALNSRNLLDYRAYGAIMLFRSLSGRSRNALITASMPRNSLGGRKCA
jgi:hypothetical protein